MRLVILVSTFFMIPAMALAYTGDPNMTPGFSDQGGSRVDIGAHASTSASVDLVQSMMAGLQGVVNGLGSPNTSGVVSQKQAAEALMRKNKAGYRVKPGDEDADNMGDIVQ